MVSPSVTLRIYLLALAIILGCSLAHAQSLKLGLHGRAVRFVPSPESSEFTDPVSDGGYGFGPWAPSVDFEIRYSPYRGIITVAGDVSYTPLKGSGKWNWVEEFSTVPGEREYTAQLYIASFGAQFKMSQGPTRPYLGARFQWSFLSNLTMRYQGTGGQEIPPRDHGSFNCFGLGLLGGVEFDIDSSWALDVTTQYNFSRIGNYSEWGYDNAFSFGIGVFYEIL